MVNNLSSLLANGSNDSNFEAYFHDFYHSSTYGRNRCETNVFLFIQDLMNQGQDIKNLKVLLLKRSYPLLLRPKRDAYRHEVVIDWQFHYVIQRGNKIYDFDLKENLNGVEVLDYFQRMFFWNSSELSENNDQLDLDRDPLETTTVFVVLPNEFMKFSAPKLLQFGNYPERFENSEKHSILGYITSFCSGSLENKR